MASVSTDSSGNRRILFCTGPGEPRKTIYLGEVTRKIANGFAGKIEELVGMRKTGIHDPSVSEWLGGLDDAIYAKVAAVGLAEPRQSKAEPAAATLGKLHAEFFASMNVKAGTRAAHKQGADSVLKYFGEAKPLNEITPLDASKWQQSQRPEGLADATISKRTLTAKMMFSRAVDWEMIAKNPF